MADDEIIASNHENGSYAKCLLFKDNPYQCDVIVIVKRVAASLSIIGSLFMIFVIWLFKKYTAFTQRLILSLTLAALMQAFAAMGDLRDDGPLCNFEGWFINCTAYCVLLWVVCITFNLYMNAVKMRKVDKYEWAYHLFSWGFSIVISCLPLFWDEYRPAGAWCWLSDWRWRFGLMYVPLFTCLIGMVVVFIYISVFMHRKALAWEGFYTPDIERQKQILKEDVKPLRAYPLAYLLLNILPLVNRIQNAVDPDNPVFILVLLHALTQLTTGAVNAIIFGLDKETMSRLTWSQIKASFYVRRHGEQSAIREYPITPVQVVTLESVPQSITDTGISDGK